MILITGATGNVGRPLVHQLLDVGQHVRAVSRNPAAADLPAAVEVVRGDPAQPQSLAAALRDVTSIVVNPRSVGTSAIELLDLARDAGVQRVVALSAINVDDELNRQPSRFRGDLNQEVERAAIASGLDWVALRSATYASNTAGLFGQQTRVGDVVRFAYGASSTAPIVESDVAAVAVQALTSDELLGRRPVLTGPQSLTQVELVDIIGKVTDRELVFHDVPPAIAAKGMERLGFGEEFVNAYLDMVADAVNNPAVVTDEVEMITGRPAQPIADWVAANAEFFARQLTTPSAGGST